MDIGIRKNNGESFIMRREESKEAEVQKIVFGTKPFKHICEVCGKTAVLTSKEAFDEGWDYPGVDGVYKTENFKILAPRTCGDCGIEKTAWWALLMEKKGFENLTEAQKLAVERIKQEPEILL